MSSIYFRCSPFIVDQSWVALNFSATFGHRYRSTDLSCVADEKSFKGMKSDCSLATPQDPLLTNEFADQILEGGVTRADGKKQGSIKRLINLVDDTDDSDVEITQPTEKTKSRRQASFGTATRKPMLQSTIDGGVGSSAHACSKGESGPMKSVIHGGRRKPPTKYVVEQLAASRNVLLHSFHDQPAGRLVKDCALGRYGIGPTFWRPQSARDRPALTREIKSPHETGPP
ncbi:hypothetical protein F2Q69_00023350 [Brassica cretica]|uniref:Uncharacterized protein n=1 Tax=Brassica cretica TaxID=69181 RepID=A0A8S9Q4U5_BRACR|nr:hypothetical protein F2Q69_00023350 [Brassica cretica]